jgi:hypothetical protein
MSRIPSSSREAREQHIGKRKSSREETSNKKDKKTHLIQPLASYLPQLPHPQIFSRHLCLPFSLSPHPPISPFSTSSSSSLTPNNGTFNPNLPPSHPRAKNPPPPHRQTSQTAPTAKIARLQVDGDYAIQLRCGEAQETQEWDGGL